MEEYIARPSIKGRQATTSSFQDSVLLCHASACASDHRHLLLTQGRKLKSPKRPNSGLTSKPKSPNPLRQESPVASSSRFVDFYLPRLTESAQAEIAESEFC